MKVKILEFAPAADEIWLLSCHPRDGYTSYDSSLGLVSILDTSHEAKQRPEILTIYAGGKATNVARVLDSLISDDDENEFELVTFLPPAPEGPLKDVEMKYRGEKLSLSTPAGVYVQLLQISGLKRVKTRFEIVEELAETGNMQTTRRCIEIILKDTHASLNFSPRIIWSERSAEAVLRSMKKLLIGTDLVAIAGAPPLWQGQKLTPYNFYAEIMDIAGNGCKFSVDTRGQYLRECLKIANKPRFMLMNRDEFQELSQIWSSVNDFPGTLIVHDKTGCWIWDKIVPNSEDPFSNAEYFPAPKAERVYSTIGAGDAMHAGFLKEFITYRGVKDKLQRAIIYSQAVALASVSNEKATNGIDRETVERIFNENFSKFINT